MSLLDLENLKTFFYTPQGICRAVDGVYCKLEKGETLGMVGESGCGKSITALSIMRLVPFPPGRIVDGAVYFESMDLLKLSEKEIRRIRGNDISIIFQEPMTSLNPVLTIDNQISEAIMLHEGLSRRDALDKTVYLLKTTGIPSPEKRVRDYPHQLSGGMRQRVMIAMALSCNPKLLIADEPTTALDVTIQAQILDLMKKLQEEFGMAIMFISHDLAVIADIASKVVVLYTGKVVESGKAKVIFNEPRHPYTMGLIDSLPHMEPRIQGPPKKLKEIPGVVPNTYNLPKGCSFHPRCRFSKSICKTKQPELSEVSSGHFCACWNR